MRNVLAISHVGFEDLGTLGVELRRRGVAVDLIDASTSDLETLDTFAPDLVVILGGPIGVYQVEAFPFLRSEIELVRCRLHAKLPTLGICLGAQIMAAALGAEVGPGSKGKEIGWVAVTPCPDLTADPFLDQLLLDAPAMFHFHGDTFDLPPGARLLARTEQYERQAFSIGDYALAFQFHPEVTAEGLERWYVGHACELAAANVDIAKLRKETHALAQKLEHAALCFWRAWLDEIFGSAVN